MSDDERVPQEVPQVSSWDHKTLMKSRENHTYQYDLYKRNPLYCGADYTCVHELLFLKHYAHPTVALFAENLLQVEKNIIHSTSFIWSSFRANRLNTMEILWSISIRCDSSIDLFTKIRRNKSQNMVRSVEFSGWFIIIFIGFRNNAREIASCCETFVCAERSESRGCRQCRISSIESSEYSRRWTISLHVNRSIFVVRFIDWCFRFMKMRQVETQAAEARKKNKSSTDLEGDVDDTESVESVSDDEFDKYLGEFPLLDLENILNINRKDWSSVSSLLFIIDQRNWRTDVSWDSFLPWCWHLQL